MRRSASRRRRTKRRTRDSSRLVNARRRVQTGGSRVPARPARAGAASTAVRRRLHAHAEAPELAGRVWIRRRRRRGRSDGERTERGIPGEGRRATRAGDLFGAGGAEIAAARGVSARAAAELIRARGREPSGPRFGPGGDAEPTGRRAARAGRGRAS